VIIGLTEMIVIIEMTRDDSDNKRTDRDDSDITRTDRDDSDNERTDRDRLVETQLPITRTTLLQTSKLLEMYTKFCIRIIIFFFVFFIRLE